MSKRVIVSEKCTNCKHKFKTEVYRTLWIEFPENRELLFTDKINIVQCPKCNSTYRAEYSLLAVNTHKNFAVWYEPVHDEALDSDAAGYSILLGPDSFYATAPRISNWNYFKQVVSKFEDGYFQANLIDKQTIENAGYKLFDTLKMIKSKKNRWSRIFHK